jgi:hypothetical protein
MDCVKDDMRIKGVSMEMTSNRRENGRKNMLCRPHLVGEGEDADESMSEKFEKINILDIHSRDYLDQTKHLRLVLWSLNTYTYHTRLIPEGVAEAFQIFLRDVQVLLK